MLIYLVVKQLQYYLDIGRTIDKTHFRSEG